MEPHKPHTTKPRNKYSFLKLFLLDCRAFCFSNSCALFQIFSSIIAGTEIEIQSSRVRATLLEFFSLRYPIAFGFIFFGSTLRLLNECALPMYVSLFKIL